MSGIVWRSVVRKVYAQGGFVHSVLVLAIGTGASQLIVILLTPLLTRIYTPLQYGGLSLFTAILAMSTVFTSGGYDAAIPLATDDETLHTLLFMCFGFVYVVTVLCSVVVGIWIVAVQLWPAFPVLPYHLWLLPIGICAAGMYQVLTLFATRKQSFSVLAQTKFISGVGQTGMQIGCGLAGFLKVGLIAGYLLSQYAAVLRLIPLVRKQLHSVTRHQIMRVAKRYYQFPAIRMWASLLNVASLQLPFILLASDFSMQTVGLFSFCFRLLGLPAALIGRAVSSVFYPKAVALQNDPEKLSQLTEKVALLLFSIAFPVFSVIMLCYQRIFPSLFGVAWSGAGMFCVLLAPWFLLWFISSPISSLLLVREWQLTSLLFTVVEVILRFAAITVGAFYHSPMIAIGLLSLSGVVISGWAISRLIRAAYGNFVRVIKKGVMISGIAVMCLLPVWVSLRMGNFVELSVAVIVSLGVYTIIIAQLAMKKGLLG